MSQLPVSPEHVPARPTAALMLVSTSIDPDIHEEVRAGRRPCPEYLRLESRHAVELLDWSALPGRGRGRSTLRVLRHAIAGLRRRKHYSAIFSDGEHLGIPVALGLKLMRRSTPHLVIGHHLTTPAKRMLLRWLRADRGMTRIVVHSRSQLEGAKAMGIPSDRLQLVPYGVDTQFWRPIPARGTGTILAPGREHRDFLTLARACGHLQNRVVLTGRSLHSPQAHATKPASWPANFVLVSVDFTGLRQLYAEAALIVVPLLPADFPAGITTLLEAMAMEKAIVVSGIDGLDGLVDDGNTAMVVPPQNPAALGDTVRRLLADPHERLRLGRNAHRTVQAEGNVDRYAQRLADCLTETAGATAVGVTR